MKSRNIILSVILIILGIVEIVIAIAGFEIPLPINIIVGLIFIRLGIKMLCDKNRNKDEVR